MKAYGRAVRISCESGDRLGRVARDAADFAGVNARETVASAS